MSDHLNAKIVADLKRELEAARAERDKLNADLACVEAALSDAGVPTLGNLGKRVADLAFVRDRERTRAEAAEQELQDIAKTVGATGDGDDVVGYVERIVEENARRAKLISQADSDKRSAMHDAEALAEIHEALGDHFACIDHHNPYTEERVPMLVEDYERTKAKLAAIRAHLAGVDVAALEKLERSDACTQLVHCLLAAAREALEP